MKFQVHEFSYQEVLLKFDDTFQIFLKQDKIKRHFTPKPTCASECVSRLTFFKANICFYATNKTLTEVHCLSNISNAYTFLSRTALYISISHITNMVAHVSTFFILRVLCNLSYICKILAHVSCLVCNTKQLSLKMSL
jgi:hypothetical protein